MKARKTWAEKLRDNKGLPKISRIEGKLSTRWGSGTFVVPAPMEVKELMDRVPKGKLTSINELRSALARKHGTDIACPITTGIFAWIAANAADEAAAAGARRITPYWRTLKNGGELNPKYPGGVAALSIKLAAEGHVVIQKGKRYFVREFSEKLVGA
jgi:DNA-binding FadR family transcriptional regulator